MNNINNIFRIGMTAAEVVAKIAEINPGISTLYFCVYHPIYNAKEIEGKAMPLLSRLLYHDTSVGQHKLCRGKIKPENINKIIASLEKNSALGVLSIVRAVRKHFHIPMMDFEDGKGRNALSVIEYFLQEIGQEGVVLTSGRSYHFYGTKLMTKEQWLNFLGDCILSGLADPRYVGHRMKDELGILRLSACPLRPKIPTIVCVVGRQKKN